MNQLEELRRRINETDAEMAGLFEHRMELSAQIAAYKKERGLSVRDPVREAMVIDSNLARIRNPEIGEYYVRYLKSVMDLSCDYQIRLMEGMKVAFCGVEGAFAWIAAEKMFPGAWLVPYTGFQDAYHAAETGECDCAVLPIENSTAGEVGTVMDLLFSGGLFINQVMECPIRHSLMGIPGTSRNGIRTVLSHPQALEQCSRYIREHRLETESCSNTAVAARTVLEREDPALAAIASEETAEKFGLEIFDHSVQDIESNTTRFAAFSRTQNTPDTMRRRGDENFILVFTVRNEAGSLAQALNIIGAHGYNMRSLRSRPMKGLQWNYYFYIEAEGNICSGDGDSLLRELSAVCARLKLVGTFRTGWSGGGERP